MKKPNPENTNRTALFFGLATVAKGHDPAFRPWACIFPDRPTRWYKTDAAARKAQQKHNGAPCGN